MWHIHCCWKLAKHFPFMHALYAKTKVNEYQNHPIINATSIGSLQMTLMNLCLALYH